MVTFNPGEYIEESLGAACTQVERLLVVDNGSAAAALSRVLSAAELHPNVEVARNNVNLGIAAALNQGVEAARAAGAEWVLTLDQDSQVPPDAVARMLAALSTIAPSERDQVAVLAPVLAYRDKELHRASVRHMTTKKRMVAITSGNLVRTKAYDAVAGYDERLFIDSVDFDFCLRLKNLGYTTHEVPAVTLQHALGKVSIGRFLGIKMRFTSYSSLRRYYQFRNRTYIYRRFWRIFPSWVLCDAILMTADVFKTLFLEPNPRAMRVALARGIRDGLKQRLGKLDGWPYPF